MVFNIILNSENVSKSNSGFIKYNFKSGSFNVNDGAQMCVSQIVYPFSWFNVNDALYNNNKFSYTWNGISNVVSIKSGHYNMSDINNYLQLYMISKGHYLVDASKNYVYYIEIKQNTSYYANSITVYSIPSSLPTGYTNPANFPFSVDGKSPSIIIPSYSSYFGFGSLIGFTAGTYFSNNFSTSTILSNTTPNLSPITSVVIRSNLVKNDCAIVPDILDSFSVGDTQFGSNIYYTPPYEKWISMNHGNYDSMFLYLQDQNFNPILTNDNNILISILIKQGPEPINKSLQHYEPKLLPVQENSISGIQENQEALMSRFENIYEDEEEEDKSIIQSLKFKF